MLVAKAGGAAVPPVPAPRPLVPFVRFARLPDRALAKVRRVLDEDVAFRVRVQSAVTADDVGPAGWLFLARPEGWEEELAASAAAAEERRAGCGLAREERTAVRRLAVADEARAEAERAAASLGEELSRVAGQLTEERRGRRAAETEAGRLRRRVAELELALEAAPAPTASASASSIAEGQRQVALDEAREALASEQRRTAVLEAQCRALEAEMDAGGGRSAAPMVGVTDGEAEARALTAVAAVAGAVGVLAEAVAAAATQLAPFLPSAPPPPEWPPAPEPVVAPARSRREPPAVQRWPAKLPPGVPDDSPEAAEHLVRLRDVIVLVDGYNVTKLARPDFVLPEQRRWLTERSAALAARSGANIEVVFDAAAVDGEPIAETPRTKVRVRWSPTGIEADDVLLDLVEELPATRPVVVVSNDRRVRSGAARRGANVLSSDRFIALLGHSAV